LEAQEAKGAPGGHNLPPRGCPRAARGQGAKTVALRLLMLRTPYTVESLLLHATHLRTHGCAGGPTAVLGLHVEPRNTRSCERSYNTFISQLEAPKIHHGLNSRYREHCIANHCSPVASTRARPGSRGCGSQRQSCSCPGNGLAAPESALESAALEAGMDRCSHWPHCSRMRGWGLQQDSKTS
jgi:hypothetical protein